MWKLLDVTDRNCKWDKLICISQLNTLSDYVFTITIEYIARLSPRTLSLVLSYDDKGDSEFVI